MKIGWLVPEIQAAEGFVKQKKTREIFPFNRLISKSVFVSFRLILLDHITYMNLTFIGDAMLACTEIPLAFSEQGGS